MRYPQAGTDNARVSLTLVTLHGDRRDVDWRSDVALDGQPLEYLADVEWSEGRPLLSLLTRDQGRLEIREVDPATGGTTLVRALTDDAWVELLPGTPRRLVDGRLLHGLDLEDTGHLAIDGKPFTPHGVQVRHVLSVEDEAVVALISPSEIVGSIVLARMGFDGSVDGTERPATASPQVPPVAGPSSSLSRRSATPPSPRRSVPTARRRALLPPWRSGCRWRRIPRSCGWAPATTRPRSCSRPGTSAALVGCPVLMCPYGGPQVQTVLRSSRAYLEQQWLANQGFVVVVADGRGMAGRGPAWDRLARHDFIGTIDDQVEVLGEVAKRYPDDVDSARVGIRGWSFGGYIAALGVLRHPDVFGAAVAGAPVTDLRLYDTCYTERYLGHPDDNPGVYDANSLISLASRLSRPLMLVHGLADDNVLVAHTLRLSSALLAAGRPHEVLPLSGMTHMADDAVVAENLLLLQVDFLRRSLGVPA